MRRFAGDLFVGQELTPADKQAIVHAFDVDDTLTRKPDNFDNTGLTKDQFFDAARDFPADEAVVELAQMLASKGDRIAIATARPAERLEETIEWLQRNNVPFDQIMLSTGAEPSGVAKQAMLQKLQDDYRRLERCLTTVLTTFKAHRCKVLMPYIFVRMIPIGRLTLKLFGLMDDEKTREETLSLKLN